MKSTIFSLCYFIVISLNAQVAPQKFNYQAVARNSTGTTIINQAISVKVDIVDSNQTTILYTEIHNITTNQFGLFSLQIGGGFTVTGTFSSINWGAREKYIRTSADLSGGTNYQLLGMSQLLSVPYALYASKTNLVAGTGINITNGNTISGNYQAGTGISISGNTISGNYQAGTGVSISGNTISATGGSSQWTNDTYGITYTHANGGIGIGGASEYNSALSITQKNTGGYSAAASFKSADTWHTVLRIDNNSNNSSYQFNLAGTNNSAMPSKSFSLYHATANNFVWNTDGTTNSYLAIGSYDGHASIPKSRLHVFNGDVNIDQIGSGIILKSPNGNCWRITIDNSGNLIRTAITCPN